jgi:hypothetical protein
MEHSLGLENVTDPFPAGVIRSTLNRNFAACYPDIHDEVVQSFSDVLALDGSGEPRAFHLSSHISLTIKTDWKAVPAMNTMLRIVCRVSNRLFVGLPLCTFDHYRLVDYLRSLANDLPTGRDPDYLDMSMTFTVDVMKTATIVNLVPQVLQP